MSVSSEITRLQNAKVNLRSALADAYGTSIPESALVDTWPQYLVPAGCYITPPQANGVYIKYVGGRYSDYNVLWSGQATVGVAVKTSSCSFCIHPSDWKLIAWCTSNVVISGVTSIAYNSGAGRSVIIADYSGKTSTAAALSSGYTVPAFTTAATATYADASTGWLPSGGELETMRLNVTNINSAMSLIGGTSLNFSTTNFGFYWTSCQLTDYPAQAWIYLIKTSNYSQMWTGQDKNMTHLGTASTDPPAHVRSITDF